MSKPQRPPIRPKITRHHILFYDQEWSLRPEGRYLREDGGLIAPLTRLEHDDLHNHVPLVPLLGVYALKRVANDYVPSGGLYRNMDNFALLTERAIHHPRSQSLERQLGELTIEAVIMQRDFIQALREESA